MKKLMLHTKIKYIQRYAAGDYNPKYKFDFFD